MKWRVLTLFCINIYRIIQERYSIFFQMFPLFSPFLVSDGMDINS